MHFSRPCRDLLLVVDASVKTLNYYQAEKL